MRIQPVDIQHFQVQANPAINGLDAKYDTPQYGFLKHAEYTQILSNIDPHLVNAIYNDPNLSQLDISCVLSLTAAYGLDAQATLNLAQEINQLPVQSRNVDYLIMNSQNLPQIPAPLVAPAPAPVINQAAINALQANLQDTLQKVIANLEHPGVLRFLQKTKKAPTPAALQQLRAAHANPNQALNLDTPELKQIAHSLKASKTALSNLQNAQASLVIRVDARIEDARASFNSFIDLYLHAHDDNRRQAGPLLAGRQVRAIAPNGFLPLPAPVAPPMPAPVVANPAPVAPPMPAPVVANPAPVAPPMPAPAIVNPAPVAPPMPAPAIVNPAPVADAARGALLAQIQQGHRLRANLAPAANANPAPVAPPMPAPAIVNPAPVADAARGALLAQIQQGHRLRANPAPAANANPAPVAPPMPAPAVANPAPVADAARGALFAQIQAGRKLRPAPAPAANVNPAPAANVNPAPAANVNPAPAANPVPAPKAAPADHGEALAQAIARPKLKTAPKAAPKQDNVPAPADFRHVLKRAPSQPVVKQPEAPALAPKAEAHPHPKRANSVPVQGKRAQPIPKMLAKKLAPKMPEPIIAASPILPPVIQPHAPQEHEGLPVGEITGMLYELIHEHENTDPAPIANPAPNPDPAPVANPALNPDPIRAESMRNLMGALQNPPQLRPAAERPVNDPILPQDREAQIAEVVNNRRAAFHNPEDDAEIDPASLVISFLANAPEPAQPEPVAAPAQRAPAGPIVDLNNLQAAFANMQVGHLLNREELNNSFSFNWDESDSE